MDVTRARALLDALVDRLADTTWALVRDSATAIYNAPGLRRADSAYAAVVIGNAYLEANDRRRFCEWVRTASRLQPTNPTYSALVGQCQS